LRISEPEHTEIHILLDFIGEWSLQVVHFSMKTQDVRRVFNWHINCTIPARFRLGQAKGGQSFGLLWVQPYYLNRLYG